MKIKTNAKLVDLKGKELPLTVGEYVGNILANSKGDKLKLFVLAQKFASSENEIDVDDADMVLVKKSIEITEIYNALVAGQLLTLLK